jgi:hypothetical protein
MGKIMENLHFRLTCKPCAKAKCLKPFLHPSLLLCALARFHLKRLLVCLNGFV